MEDCCVEVGNVEEDGGDESDDFAVRAGYEDDFVIQGRFFVFKNLIVGKRVEVCGSERAEFFLQVGLLGRRKVETWSVEDLIIIVGHFLSEQHAQRLD